MATVVAQTALAALEVRQTPKQVLSLATRSRSLPSQQAETEVPAAAILALTGTAAPPPYRAAALVRQFFGSSTNGGTVTVSGTAIGGDCGGLCCTAGISGNGASVRLISNGGVNDAVGGATSGILNLTQTAQGGRSLDFGGSATSTLIGTNPFGANPDIASNLVSPSRKGQSGHLERTAVSS